MKVRVIIEKAGVHMIAKLDCSISKADALVIEQGTPMYSLLVNVRDYLSKLRFEGMDMQLTNECWIELIEKELRKVRGYNEQD